MRKNKEPELLFEPNEKKTALVREEPTAIIAGNGQLPIAVAKALETKGQSPFLVPLRGEAAAELYAYPHEEISVIEFAKLIGALKRHHIKNVVLAGGVTKRPNLRDVRLDWPTMRALPRLALALGRGDDALLRAFIKALEAYKFQVCGAHQLVPELLAGSAPLLTRCQPSSKMRQDIELAAQGAQMLGALDVGQGAVAVRGRIVALEGAEGTDEMLARVEQLRRAGRIPRAGGVLVKVMKPAQEARADLPTIGPVTIENAHKAGLDGVAVEKMRSFILEPARTVELADQHKIFIEVISL